MSYTNDVFIVSNVSTFHFFSLASLDMQNSVRRGFCDEVSIVHVRVQNSLIYK